MRKLQLALLLILCVFILTVIVIFSAPNFINWQNNKGFVENFLSEYTGYKTKINGDLELQLLPNPKLYATDISIESMSSEQNLAKAGHIIITKKLSDFFKLDFSFDKVVINRPQINLVQEDNGSKNWEPLRVKNSNYYGKKLKGFVANTLKAKEITVENGSILYTDLIGEKSKDVTNIYGKVTTLDSNKIKLKFRSSFNKEENNLTLDFAKVGSKSAKIDLKASAKSFSIDLNGVVNDLYNFRRIGFIGKLSGNIEDANVLKTGTFVDEIKDKYLDLKNISIKSDISISKEKTMIEVENLSSVNKKLKGSISYEIEDSRPLIDINLDIARLDFKKPEGSTLINKDGFQWSDELLDLSFVHNITLNTSIKCEECVYGKQVFKQLNLKSTLENNNLIISQLSLKSTNNGFIKGSLNAGLNSPIALEAKIEAADFPLHQLIPSVLKNKAEFNLEGHANIIASGVSEKAMVSNMSGTINIAARNTNVHNINPSNLKTLAEGVLQGKRTTDYPTSLGDVKAEGAFRDGVFRATNISFKFNNHSIISKGKLDLANLTMSYRVEPTVLSRNFLGVVVSGDIAKPEITADKITPKGVVDGFGRLVTRSITKKVYREEVKTPFNFDDRHNLDKNINKYLFEEK